MNEGLTKLISCPSFSTADKYILERIDKTKLTEWIDFLRSYRKVLWRDGDIGNLVPLEELRKRKSRIQPLPKYPKALKEMGAFSGIFCWIGKNSCLIFGRWVFSQREAL